MMIKSKLPKLKFAIFGFLVLLLALSPVTSVLAQGLGHGFYGTVKIGGDDAEIGTVISARVAGTEYGSCQVATPGQYALIVQGEIEDSATINFYINFQPADQTFPFHDGWTTQLDLTVAEAEPVTVNVIVEGQTSTIWYGRVTFQESTIIDKQDETHFIDYPTALGALDKAAEVGGFTYVVTSAYGPLGFVEEIDGEVNTGQSGWMYQVNDGDIPMVPAVDYPLNNGDEVLWYYGDWDAGPYIRPVGDTNAASSITRTSATLNGNLTGLGTASSVEVSFEWGTTDAYGRGETATQTMTYTGPFSFSLSGLSDDTTYHFRAKAVGHGTDYGADRTFTTTARPPAGGGGIGPGRVPAGTTDVRGEISWEGVFEEPVTAFSDDELCTLTIPEGTVGLTEDLEPLDEITILREDDPPEPPEDADIVTGYDLGPDGATFEPAITLTFSYDPDDIPEGKDVLVVAYYDEVAEAWVYLEGEVDTVSKTITVSISHFTTFAIIARATPPAAPAAFSVTNLLVKPLEVELKEVVTISLSVANTGGTEGSYTVVLKINGVKEADKSVTIAAGKSKSVSFSVAKEKAGSYSVVVDGLSASFTVVEPVPEEEVAPPEEEEEVVPEAPAEVPPAINWPVLGGVIAALVVVGVLIFLLVRRRGVRA